MRISARASASRLADLRALAPIGARGHISSRIDQLIPATRFVFLGLAFMLKTRVRSYTFYYVQYCCFMYAKLALLDACARIVVNYDVWEQCRLTSARLSQNVFCGRCNSQRI